MPRQFEPSPFDLPYFKEEFCDLDRVAEISSMWAVLPRRRGRKPANQLSDSSSQTGSACASMATSLGARRRSRDQEIAAQSTHFSHQTHWEVFHLWCLFLKAFEIPERSATNPTAHEIWEQGLQGLVWQSSQSHTRIHLIAFAWKDQRGQRITLQIHQRIMGIQCKNRLWDWPLNVLHVFLLESVQAGILWERGTLAIGKASVL